VLTGEPLGGPLAFPFLILVGLIASTFAVAAVLFPVSAFTEWICLSRQIQRPWQIPLAAFLLADGCRYSGSSGH
jgi:hypothetical protein